MYSIACWSLGWLPSDELPQVAERVLAEGFESPALVKVACSDYSADPGLHGLFEKALNDFGRARMKKSEAGLFIARRIAKRIVQGGIAPCDGARDIWKVSLECKELSSKLGIFGGRVTEIEDQPKFRDQISRLIIQDAENLLLT